MKTINTLIESYLASKELAWEKTTLRSETYRLYGIAEFLDGKPDTLWKAIANHGAYSRQTIWTRVANLWSWAGDNGYVTGNPYKVFREENARLFKHVYTKRKPSIDYAEAKRRIESIGSEAIRIRALRLLETGMRFNESRSVRDGQVCGKGSKTRTVYIRPNEERVDDSVQYHTFRRALSAVGLKPHDLRKVFLSKLVELGINEFELCEIAGWSSIETASSYIKVNQDKLRRLVERVQGGIENATEVQIP